MNESIGKPEDVSDAAWMHDIALRLRDARRTGDREEQARLVRYVRSEGNKGLADLIDTVMTSAELSDLTRSFGLPPVFVPQGAPAPEDRICDFCAAPTVAYYYPFERFQYLLEGVVQADSGDRMYVCQRCHGYVEANDWKALRNWVGPSARANGQLWIGFKLNRTGPAQPFDPADAR